MKTRNYFTREEFQNNAMESIKNLLDVIRQAKKVHGTEGCKEMYDTLKEMRKVYLKNMNEFRRLENNNKETVMELRSGDLNRYVVANGRIINK